MRKILIFSMAAFALIVALTPQDTGIVYVSQYRGIQEAVNACENNIHCGTVYIESGTYVINTPINITRYGISLIGSSPGNLQEPLDTSTYPRRGTVIMPSSSFPSDYAIRIQNTTTATSVLGGIRIQDITFYGKDDGGTKRFDGAIYGRGIFLIIIDGISVLSTTGDAVNIEAIGTSGDSNIVRNSLFMDIGGTGIHLWSWMGEIIDNEIINAKWAIDAAYHVNVGRNRLDGISQYGIIARDHVSVTDNRIFSGTGYSNIFISGDNVLVYGNFFKLSGYYGSNNPNIEIDSGTNISIFSNSVLAGANTNYFLKAASSSSGLVSINYFYGAPNTAKILDNSGGKLKFNNNYGLSGFNHGINSSAPTAFGFGDTYQNSTSSDFTCGYNGAQWQNSTGDTTVC